MAKKKPATAAEKRYMGRVAALGCCICEGPALIHHCGTYIGGGRDHMKTIPLCHYHHDGGVEGDSLHKNKAAWEIQNGTEEYWLEHVNEALNYEHRR